MIIKGNSVGYPLPDPRKGLEMQGAINMNGQKLFGITDPENFDDAVNLRYLKNALVISSAIITLPANGWVKGEDLEYSQTINLEGIGDPEKCHVFSNPMPESRDVYLDADVYGKSQSVGSLTFGCKYEPKEDIMLKLIIFGGNVIGNNTGGNTEQFMLNMDILEDGYSVRAEVGDEIYGIKNATVNQGATEANYDFTIL